MAQLICGQQIARHIPEIIQNSGHFLMQYGDYKDCLDMHGYNYNLVQFGIGKTNAGLYMGLCLPKQCTSKIIKSYLQKILQKMEVPYSIYDVQSDIQNYHFQYTPLFYITVLVMMILVVLVLVSTVGYKKESKYVKLFSLQQTTKIFRNKESQLNVFNGVRALSMMWVILGHTYLNSLGGVQNTFSINDIFSQPFILLVSGAFNAVDVFFFLGGFFMAFVFMREKSKSLLIYPLGILQRALRIWPAYLMDLLFYYTVYMHLGSGPKWGQMEPVVQVCSNLWRSLLFIDNLVLSTNEIPCLQWGWYLQVDFQIFVVCLVLLGIYKFNKIVSFVVSGVLIIGSWVFNIIYTQNHNQKMFTNAAALYGFQEYFNHVYIQPYARWTTYIMGMYIGLLYCEYNASKKDEEKRKGIVLGCHRLKGFLERRRVVRVGMEWLGIGLMAFVVFIPRVLQIGYEWDQIWHSLYFCFAKVVFIIGLTLVLLSTLLGVKGSFFMTILDTKLFSFIAKISFCTYLVHLIFITQYLAVFYTDLYYNIQDRYVILLGFICASCFFGFLLTIVVEVPFSYLQKEVMNKFKGKKKEERKNDNREIEDVIRPLNQSVEEEQKMSLKLR